MKSLPMKNFLVSRFCAGSVEPLSLSLESFTIAGKEAVKYNVHKSRGYRQPLLHKMGLEIGRHHRRRDGTAYI